MCIWWPPRSACLLGRSTLRPTRRPCCRQCRPWIFGPRVFGVAATQFLPYVRIRPIPETPQVSLDLDGATVGRQQREDDRFGLAPDPRRLCEPKELLELDRCRHAAVAVVLERM